MMRTIQKALGISATVLTAALTSEWTLPAMADSSDARLRFLPGPEGAPFSRAVIVDGVLYMSGQIGLDANNRLPEGMQAQASQVMENMAVLLRENGATMRDVFKCTVMLANMAQWAEFNKVYVRYFDPGRLPARSAFGSSGLVGGALVELECWAVVRR